ncbi:MAG: hypothetical protein Ta2E_09080 [Mycoplasmoidaceae bacterium]|nr:MAG: hypothetical protein Ta2E_09080 [Mycoplasmoidaceae bacterium]
MKTFSISFNLNILQVSRESEHPLNRPFSQPLKLPYLPIVVESTILIQLVKTLSVFLPSFPFYSHLVLWLFCLAALLLSINQLCFTFFIIFIFLTLYFSSYFSFVWWYLLLFFRITIFIRRLFILFHQIFICPFSLPLSNPHSPSFSSSPSFIQGMNMFLTCCSCGRIL